MEILSGIRQLNKFLGAKQYTGEIPKPNMGEVRIGSPKIQLFNVNRIN